MMEYLVRLLEWAEPKYRFALETACELAVLAWRGLRWLLRAALAVLLFPAWLIARSIAQLRRNRKGGDG